ncbi:IS4 family transposase [Fulvivirga maritima]|uniref:IS4 family transposase n=1 Tax=Fulvivirga maritima TaxID=2904247 RepID=UPI001F472309|nr:IS4 family transposase [Fulvivirga maritima]UII25900.1 IS4 family transposase [Fulvivirga maritima]UII26745.1 IS4 family transposase [Fulvivirga maritima]UII27693.1 IS4 family transposase [Fulvivirga maritima]
MSKNTYFYGQPIFSQLLSLIDKSVLNQIISKHQSDRYYKKLNTWHHLVSMLYCCFSGASALRELTTGLLACQNKLIHLGIQFIPRRSTLSDSNKKRSSIVFADIYMKLFKKYRHLLPDSRLRMEVLNKLYIVDSTIISLFKDILKVAGRPRKDGKSKGGIKAHVMIHAAELMPCLVRLTKGSQHDHTFLKQLQLPEGSYVVMDKGYIDYRQYAQWSHQGIFYITRMKENARYQSIDELELPEDKDFCVLKDEKVVISFKTDGQVQELQNRRIAYYDDLNNKLLVFMTNNMELEAATIAAIYKYRWQIELLFKKLKQNFPLKYFLGDNQNAIEIQIWSALICLLLMEVVRKQIKKRWAFSNMVSLVRFHLMAYVHLTRFLNNPDLELQKTIYKTNQYPLFSP